MSNGAASHERDAETSADGNEHRTSGTSDSADPGRTLLTTEAGIQHSDSS
jgi:hypothetical protein